MITINSSQSLMEEQIFTCLSIEIPAEADKQPVSLLNCIDMSFGEEVLVKDSYKCWSCLVSSKGAKRSTQLKVTPQLLILHLKRFRQTGRTYRKNRGEVVLPDTLVVHQQTYRICAVVNHTGALMNSGHYTADLLVRESDWKRCDDSLVRKGRSMNCGSSEAYLVFCEQMNSLAWKGPVSIIVVDRLHLHKNKRKKEKLKNQRKTKPKNRRCFHLYHDWCLLPNHIWKFRWKDTGIRWSRMLGPLLSFTLHNGINGPKCSERWSFWRGISVWEARRRRKEIGFED